MQTTEPILCSRTEANSASYSPRDYRLREEDLVRLTGVMVWLHAAPRVQVYALARGSVDGRTQNIAIHCIVMYFFNVFRT